MAPQTHLPAWPLWITVALVILIVNAMVFQKEHLLAEGDTVLLPLAPRDPRSLLQGDFMRLRYELTRQLERTHKSQRSYTGYALLRLNENGVGEYVQSHLSPPDLQPNERLIYFRKRGDHVRFASADYFFQEGHGEYYEQAAFGELKVSRKGQALLVGVRDRRYQRLDAPDGSSPASRQ
ncbi:MAG: GDYXXLXY domain-containing protein [Pseudomonadales bacterium]|nr:GDYXXLXY domain-containing protein [Pseudomonadales bacterium]